MRDPTAAAHTLGKLLTYVGEDRLVWGTDSIWFGTPQDQIQALRSFQISEELQERHGYPALSDELKAKIFGLNSAVLYGRRAHHRPLRPERRGRRGHPRQPAAGPHVRPHDLRGGGRHDRRASGGPARVKARPARRRLGLSHSYKTGGAQRGSLARMTNTNPVHRYPTITPHLGVDDPAAALDFYKRAFDAQELVRLALPDGTIAHAEMLVGDALVTLGKAIPEYHLSATAGLRGR